MQIKTEIIQFEAKGFNHIIDITSEVQSVLHRSQLNEGHLLVSAIGSTTGITTLEYEPGLVIQDVNELFEQIAPYDKRYKHNATWGDDNGAAHLRSMITGTSQTFPFVESKLILGTWQQIVFMDFDTRPRQRKVVVQLLGS